MAVNLALYYSEQLPGIVRAELEQLIASLSTQLGQPTPVSRTRSQLIEITYASGATSATAAIPQPVELSQCELHWLGERVPSSGSVTTQDNTSGLDVANCSGSQLAIKRLSGQNSGGGSIQGTVTIQVVDQRTSSI